MDESGVYFAPPHPQGVILEFLVGAFVVMFIASASLIALLAAMGRHRDPPNDS